MRHMPWIRDSECNNNSSWALPKQDQWCLSFVYLRKMLWLSRNLSSCKVGSKTERRDYVHTRLGSETPRTTTMSDSSLKPAAYRLVVCCCTRSLGRFAWLSWIWHFMHNNKQLILLSICRSWTKCSWHWLKIQFNNCSEQHFSLWLSR